MDSYHPAQLPLKQDGHDGKTQEWEGSPVLSFYVGRSVPGNGDSQAHSGLVGASAENRLLWRVGSCLTWATRAPLRGDKEPPGVSDSGDSPRRCQVQRLDLPRQR